jgi:hypothetical protein
MSETWRLINSVRDAAGNFFTLEKASSRRGI